ncbi:EF-P 5-aminopentanol modification-associated protein YfmF [Candidatus Contubernalis alkaliaceticus]|uniref:EF-P 5-aminopentanol modification-associated protein YfmF n=1 Tax=Candidatus Contubernalis alkaliaceticus TaxID=338645 RepID=UPI001F4C4C19|nr:pitrilysin family protein [Candidatus Contubernalis alkalaceticus]UNC91472.1 insulinase family protein [Candidatus Contubernalis alkalaceticus]
MTNFINHTLPNGINLYIYPTEKFKTIVYSLFLHQNLKRDLVTKTALLPFVLERGSKKWPNTQKLVVALENLYGADIMSEVTKRGERQILQFILEIVNPLYVRENGELEKKGLEVLKDVLTNPVVENNGFKESFVNREKQILTNIVQGLINDKVSYAVERCVQEMCREEDYGVYRLGRVEDLPNLDSSGLYSYYQELLNSAPIDIFVLGNVDPDNTMALMEEAFNFPRGNIYEMEPTLIYKEVSEPRYVEERLDVNQGKLTLGFRTNTKVTDDDYYPLLLYNGILGAFPHSKLFQNVREKASLAYYASSRLDREKGILLIASGIEIENYQKALEIIQQQMESIKAGDITDDELDSTRVGYINQIKVTEDSPYQIINRYLGGLISGRQETEEETIEQINRVQVEDVVRVAEKIQLDTIYFLRNKE